MAIETAKSIITGLYYGYQLAKELKKEFEKASLLPLDREIGIYFSLVIKFKPALPKFREVEDTVIRFLKDYSFDRRKGTIELNINEKTITCAIEYHITTNILLPFGDELEEISFDEEEFEELYELTIADDLTLEIIPKLQGLNKEEAERALKEVYFVLDTLLKKFYEKFNVRKSSIWINLRFKNKETAEILYRRLVEKVKEEMSKAKILEPESSKNGDITIRIRDVDTMLIHILLSIKLKRWFPW